MAAVQVCWSRVVLLLITLTGVQCDDYNIGGLVAASGIAFIFFAIVIAMLIIGFTWKNWYPAIQMSKGKVKMPREYWKKKEEAKRRLINGSPRTAMSSFRTQSDGGLPNGYPAKVVDTADNALTASWIQGGGSKATARHSGYEEMALSMDLEEEKYDEFKIETSVVDNEVLDLGPFKDSDVASRQIVPPIITVEMTEDVTADDAESMYSTVDKSRKTSRQNDGDEAEAASTSEAMTSFSKLDPFMVAL